MSARSKSKLRLDRETVLVLSGSALAQVAGGAGDPRVPEGALPAKAQVGDAISTLLRPTGRCIVSCFCR